MPKYNVAEFKTCTWAEGPGRRAAIWFQGCDIRCEGCCNPGLQPFVRRHVMTLEEIVSACAEAVRRFGIEGVTLLGGEPTLQDVGPLCAALHGMGLGVILFTGRRFEDLNPSAAGCADLVVDGPYVEELADGSRNLVGSSNQRIVDVSGRYADDLGWFEEERPPRVEASLDRASARITGDPVLARHAAGRERGPSERRAVRPGRLAHPPPEPPAGQPPHARAPPRRSLHVWLMIIYPHRVRTPKAAAEAHRPHPSPGRLPGGGSRSPPEWIFAEDDEMDGKSSSISLAEDEVVIREYVVADVKKRGTVKKFGVKRRFTKVNSTGRVIVTNRRIVYTLDNRSLPVVGERCRDLFMQQVRMEDVQGFDFQALSYRKPLLAPCALVVAGAALVLAGMMPVGLAVGALALIWLALRSKKRVAMVMGVRSFSNNYAVYVSAVPEKECTDLFCYCEPTSMFETMAKEIGAVVLDLQKYGDDCLPRWIAQRRARRETGS